MTDKPPTMIMNATRLHGPSNPTVETVCRPGPPGVIDALLKVQAVSICGNDLLSYADIRIRDAEVKRPIILGNEFSAMVEEAGIPIAQRKVRTARQSEQRR